MNARDRILGRLRAAAPHGAGLNDLEHRIDAHFDARRDDASPNVLAQRMQSALEAVRGRPVLTITDERGGQAQGMIHFRLLRGRVRFQVDVAEASRAGLSISSKLLRLAQTVRR